MKDLLVVNLHGNLQIIVQVKSWVLRAVCDFCLLKWGSRNSFGPLMQTSKEYSEQLGVDACIKLFEQFKSYEGLYFFLGSYLSSRYSIYFLVGENKTGIHAVFMSWNYFLQNCLSLVVRIPISTSSTLKQLQKLDKLRKWNVLLGNQTSMIQKRQRTF